MRLGIRCLKGWRRKHEKGRRAYGLTLHPSRRGSIVTLTGVSRGTDHDHRQLWRSLRKTYPKLRVERVSYQDALALRRPGKARFHREGHWVTYCDLQLRSAETERFSKALLILSA